MLESSQTHILPRERVTAALAESVAGYPLTVLTAPAGYGKTTAVWALLEGQAQPFFYLSVPQEPGNARSLWNTLCDQLARRGGAQCIALAAALKSLGFPQDAASADLAVQHLREHLAAVQTLAVLDDWHFAILPEFDRFLERLVRANISGLTVLLVSRARPGLSLEDLQVKGLASVLPHDLLTFSAAEAVAYFTLHGIGDARSAQTAWKEYEGWAAALWLAAQSYKTHGALRAGQDVERLIEDVVFACCTADEQRLLVCTSLLESFTPEQAALLSENTRALRLLKNLHSRNALMRYDPVAGRYRLHSLFRTFLAEELRAQSGRYGIDKAALYRLTGEALLNEGDMAGAARFFAKAGRDEDSVRLLDIFGLPRSAMLLFLSATEIVPLVQAVPWRLRVQRPMQYLAFLYYCLIEAGLAEALPWLDEAQARFAREKSIAPALRKRLKGEAMLIRFVTVFNDLGAMFALHKEAHALLGGRSAIAARHLIWTFGCPHSAYLYLRDPGGYKEVVRLFETDFRYYQELSGGCGLGGGSLFRAEYLLETGAFGPENPEGTAAIEQHLAACMREAALAEQTDTILNAVFCLARLYAATNRAAEAAALLEEWTPKVHAMAYVDMSTCFELTQGYMHAGLGRRGDIPEWLQTGEVPPSRRVLQCMGFIFAVCGKVALLAGEYSRLEVIAKSLPASLGSYNNVFGRIHSAVQEAIAARHLYGMDQASAHMRRALDLAQADGILLSIAEYGKEALPVLKRLRQETPAQRPGSEYSAFLGDLIALTERQIRSLAGPSPHPKKGKLTPRQREMLLLVAKGKSNAAIAEHLGVTPDTVNKILRSAYVRLRVKNRMEAVRTFSG